MRRCCGDRFRLAPRPTPAVIATAHRVVALVQISLSPSVPPVTCRRRGKRLMLLGVGALLPSRPLCVGCLPDPALARLQPNRALRARGGAVSTASAIRVPAYKPHTPTGLPSRAVSARESSGPRRPASRVLLLPPRRLGAEPLLVRESCRSRTASVCRTGHAFVTLPLLLTSARKREDAGASPGSPSCPKFSSRSAKPSGGPPPNGIAAMVGERIDLARKPLRLRGSLFDLRNLA